MLQCQGHLDDALGEYKAAKRTMSDLTQRDPENAQWQRDLSAAHSCVGGVFQAQARLGDALREYEAYKQIMLQLTKAEPENTYWQRDLSIAQNRIGGVLQARGQLGDALREYEQTKPPSKSSFGSPNATLRTLSGSATSVSLMVASVACSEPRPDWGTPCASSSHTNRSCCG